MLATRRPTGRQALGATPGRASLFPVAAPAPGLSSSPQQQLLDQRYIQRMFADGALGGLWLPEPQYLYEDSAGTTRASINGVVGAWGDVVIGLQATTANKPYLRRTPVSGKYWLDGNTATAAMTATFPSSLGSACTVARANADGVTITPAQTITTTYNLTPPYGYNSAVMIINRALTASETAVVSRYLRNWVPVLGGNIFPYGTFDSNTETGWASWTTSAGISLLKQNDSKGIMLPNNTGSEIDARYDLTVSPGQYYVYAKIRTVIGSPETKFMLYLSNGLNYLYAYGHLNQLDAAHSCHVTQTTLRLYAFVSNNFTGEGTFDNIVVRKIL